MWGPFYECYFGIWSMMCHKINGGTIILCGLHVGFCKAYF